MSSALRAEQPSRTWWSLSSKSSKQDLHKQYANDRSSSSVSRNSSGRNFPSFASVIGFKSKKHPTLAIQDPPSPLKSHSAARTRQEIPPQFHSDYHSRPQLKTPSLPLSPADSIELVTPVDSHREGRQSLLTLSDTDPFGARGITLHPSPSPTHLSTHSNSSFLDVSSKQDKHSLYVRGSYSSSSSNSHSPRESQPYNFLKVQNPTTDMRTLSTSKSLSNLQRKPNQPDPEPPLPSALQSQSQPNSRPPTRSRGMTESISTRPPFLQETYTIARFRHPSSPGGPPSVGRGMTPPPSLGPGSQPPSRPSSRPPSVGHTAPTQLVSAGPVMKTQTITRQTSIQRFQPPTAPPTHELPAPPKVPEEPTLENELDIPPACNSSLSSSSLSFVSSLSSGKELTKRQNSDLDKWSFVTSLRPETELDGIPFSTSSRPPSDMFPLPRALKVPSCASPTKRPSPVETSLPTSSEPPAQEAQPKVVKKQRSHHRLAIPPISLGFKHAHTASSISTPSSPQIPEPPTSSSIVEQRRGSTPSHASVPIIPVRRRVFSGSSARRPSTSSSVPVPPTATEDDARSLFSLRSDHDVFMNASPFKPWPTNMSTFASFWDDQPPLSPVRSEYMPQPIMSPEDQAKVEAELDDISVVSALPPPTIPLPSTRQRTTSASTILSDRDSEIIPSSIFSLPLSEPRSIKSPLDSAQSIKSGVSSVNEAGNGLGAGVGRAGSLISRSMPVPQLSRRPATASGATNLGPVAPMSTIHEPDAFETAKASLIDASVIPAASVTPATPVSPLNIRKSQRKNSNASSNPPTPQLRSLPPPPRPRAKAEVVTIANPQSNSPITSCHEGGVRSSIGVDFGQGQRHGHAVSPSVQSMNSSFSTHAAPPQNKPPHSPYVPPVPPRALSRPPPLRRPRAVVNSQPQPPNVMNGGTKVSRRISLQRKPSFLDIDDDDDDMDCEGNLDFASIMRISSTSSGGASFARSDFTAASATESFLEMSRESFDTIRSAEFGPEKF